MRIAIIDADVIAYNAAFAAETPTDWGEGIWTLHAFEDEAIRVFDTLIEQIMEKVEAGSCRLAFSSKTNWRKKVLPTYKNNRSKVRKPVLLSFLREYAKENFQCDEIKDLEGDDVLGMMATFDPNTIVCSIDKDFKTIPGKHYNFGRDEHFEISEHQADYWHMFQTLTGDTTDGYTGCPGCGPKTAERILLKAMEEGTPWASPGQLREIYWEAVVKTYEAAKLSEEEALVQARVARILRVGEYDFKTKQVKLWTPN